MSKEQFLAAHEREVAEYMDRNPKVAWSTAYERTADRAWDRMRDDLADAADRLHQAQKDEGL